MLLSFSSRAADSSSKQKQVPAKQTATKQTAAKAAATKSAVTKQPAAKSASATAAKTGTSKSATSTKAATSKLAAKKAPPRPRYYAQMQPEPERYKEIQQALADKGYFSGTPDGVWGASSTDALKRFQHDQNLSEDGKLDSLSLIALGLGPKRTTTGAPPATGASEEK